MKWLWQEYDKDGFYRIEPAPVSPREKVCSRGPGECAINPLVRFRKIFEPLYREDVGLAAMPGLRRAWENFLLHMLARADRLSGIHHWTLRDEAYLEQLAQGRYGEEIQARFNSLDTPEKVALAFLLRRQDEGRRRRLYFAEALKALFPGCILYYYQDEKRHVVWLPGARDEDALQKLALAEDLFLDFTARKPRYFWREHFGIVDSSPSMHLDRMAIY